MFLRRFPSKTIQSTPQNDNLPPIIKVDDIEGFFTALESTASTTTATQQTSSERDGIENLLTREAQARFKIKNVGPNSHIVVGDADGSTARIVYASLCASRIVLTSDAQKALASLLNCEAEFLKNINTSKMTDNETFSEWQKNPDVRKKLAILSGGIIIHGNNMRDVICIGDYVFHRFTNSLAYELRIRNQLHEAGVKFVRGNHDVTSSERDGIENLLTREAQARFKIKNVGSVLVNSPIVVGDADGSTARIVYASLCASRIVLTSDAQKALASLLNCEAEFLKNINTSKMTDNETFSEWQKNPDVRENLAILSGGIIIYGNNMRDVICIGDCVFDRFTNSLAYELRIRNQLHEAGVKFVRGNHDVIPMNFFTKGVPCNISRPWQFGYYANRDGVSEAEIEKHLSGVFKNAIYYNNTLYTHHGIVAGKDDNKIWLRSAFGEVLDGSFMKSTINIPDFIAHLNNMPVTNHEAFTNFRIVTRTGDEISSFLKECLPEWLKKTPQVHGHDGKFSTNDPLWVNINARGNDVIYDVVIIILGGEPSR